VSTFLRFPRSTGQGWVATMEKWLCWGSIGVSGLLLLLFLLDMIIDHPFGGNVVVDIFAMLACGVVLFLGWDAWRDLR
jgi:hypothetical protein